MLKDVFDFQKRMAAVLQKIPQFSGSILPVTKSLTVKEMSILLNSDVVDVGENRVQSIVEKNSVWGQRFRWHMIGHLQKNKVKKVVRYCAMIHSVHSLSLAEAIEKEAKKQNKKMSILLQVNVSQDPQKQGVLIEELFWLYKNIQRFSHVSLQGLMTIASLTDDLKKIRYSFSSLRKWTNLLELEECSMGMSHDYEIACKEGSTILRLGRVLFF